jgi:hypothetical protein
MIEVRRCARFLVAPAVLAGALLSASTIGAAISTESVSRTQLDRTADEQRTTTSELRRGPRTMRMRLRSGKVITVWRMCAIRKDIAGKSRAAEREADRLDPLERAVTAREAVVNRFLDAHPEQALAPSAYARYEVLRQSYKIAVSRFNAQIARYNAAAKRHNDALYACKV